MVSVLFVCLGNICRSPMAEGLFIHMVEEAGLSDKIRIDSCGTGAWHTGERADRRMRETAAKHGVNLPSRARQIHYTDFVKFDYIIPMDSSNLRDVERLAREMPEGGAQIIKMRYFDADAPNADVPDPYYGGRSGFDDVYEMLQRSCSALLAFIRQEHGI